MHLSPSERTGTLEVVLDEVGDRTTVVAGLTASATGQRGRTDGLARR
jgi:hypothetical protein